MCELQGLSMSPEPKGEGSLGFLSSNTQCVCFCVYMVNNSFILTQHDRSNYFS